MGEKRLRPTYAGVSAERQTLRPRTTTAMRTTAPRRAREPDPPDRSPRTVSIRSGGGRAFAAAHPKRQAPVWPLRGEVATMRGRNKMRFSAPTREPPGGRPSRGAKLKGRGCTRQKDAAARRSAEGVRGRPRKPRASKEPRTRLALEPKTLVWSRASGAQRNACRGTDEGSGGVAQGRQQKKAHEAQHFFLLALVIALRTPRQAQEAATKGTPISPSC